MRGFVGVLLFAVSQGAPPSVPYRWEDALPNIDFRTESQGSAGDFAAETVVRTALGRLEFSLDGGGSWRPAPGAPPGEGSGRLAVSADGRVWVWNLPAGSSRTDDYGFVWTPCEGLPPGLCVVADRTSPSRFYALDLREDRLYLSEDGARNFRARALKLPRGETEGELFPTPGRSGDLWISAPGGLYHAPVGRGWARMPGVSEARAFGFGKGRGETPALYLVGQVEGTTGIFRSLDEARGWARIDGGVPTIGSVTAISGDPKRFGRVYVESRGRGLLIGDSK